MSYLISILLGLSLSSTVIASEIKNSCVAITKDKLCIQVEWIEGPYINAYSQNKVVFKDLIDSQNGQAIYKTPKGSIQFYSWMIMHGHQHGGRPVETQEIEKGVYLNSKIYYMGGMMGSWQFKLKLNNEEFVLHNLEI